MIPYLLPVFLEAFGSAQLYPLSTHATFFAVRGFGGAELTPLAVAGVAGGALGQMVNYALGRGVLWLRGRHSQQLYINDAEYAQGARLFRYFLPLVFFSWFGLLGLLVAAAGFFRAPWWAALLWVVLGYAAFFGYWVLT